MDLSAADPDGTDVPVYDEDPDEAFTGPVNLANFFAEESDIAELFTGDYEEDEYYDGDALEPTPSSSYGPGPSIVVLIFIFTCEELRNVGLLCEEVGQVLWPSEGLIRVLIIHRH